MTSVLSLTTRWRAPRSTANRAVTARPGATDAAAGVPPEATPQGGGGRRHHPPVRKTSIPWISAAAEAAT